MDHHFLMFWLWAFITDAEEFLRASGDLRTGLAQTRLEASGDLRTGNFRLAQMRLELTKYHFVTTMGSLLRNLRRLRPLFPSISTAWDQAKHLRKEGKDLRDMIEHADKYIAGEGLRQDKFVREAEGVATNLPGDRPGQADATSLVVDNNGHWLGGRLNVERALAEARAILAEAEKIPQPTT
jgi:hypothetical protein